LLSLIPRDTFNAIVTRHEGDKGVRRFRCWNQLVTLFYAQLTGQHSLRDLQTAVNANLHKLGHVALAVSRSTLGDANARRSAEIYRELFYCLYRRCRERAPRHGFRFDRKLYSLDSTVVDLCLKVFDWAKFRKRKGAIKLHLMLDHDGHIPSFCVITPGRESDTPAALRTGQHPDLRPGLYRVPLVRAAGPAGGRLRDPPQEQSPLPVLERRPPGTDPAVTSDQTIRLTGERVQCLSTSLRRVGYRDPETGHFYAFLTNLFHLQAEEIAAIYKARWEIELFFKWVKQHLKIKSFLGTSRNAVLTQVWVALSVYLLAAYVHFLTGSPWRLYETFKRLQVAALEYVALGQLLSTAPKTSRRMKGKCRQLNLLGRKVKPLLFNQLGANSMNANT
jgi:hypothetical protein